jgi:hypothetical protein
MDLNFTEDEPFYTPTLFDFVSGVSDQSWTSSHILTLCICLPLITLGIAGNGLLIASWFVDKRIRTPSNALLVSLAVPDILLWTFSAPFRLTTLIRDGNWLQGRFMCETEIGAAYLLSFISSGHLVLIAVDRYRILTEGVAYLQRRTTKSILEAVAWLWFIGFWLISPLLVDWEGTGIHEQDANTGRWVCGTKKTTTFILPFVLATAVLPELLLIRLYTEIFRMLKIRFTHKLVGTGKEQHDDPRSGTGSTDSSGKGNRKDGQQMKTYSSTGNDGLLLANQGTAIMVDHHRQAEADRKERRAAITLGVLIIGFIVCWTPYIVVVLIHNIFRHKVPDIFYIIFGLIGLLNSLINPIIYAVRSRDFRRAFRKVINGIFVGIPLRAFSSVRDLC